MLSATAKSKYITSFDRKILQMLTYQTELLFNKTANSNAYVHIVRNANELARKFIIFVSFT